MELPEHEFKARWSVEACLANIEGANRIMAPFKWFGGKGKLASWIDKYLPTQGRIYVEPFAGAASVFWRIVERKGFDQYALNDIDTRIATLYRVLRDPEKFQELKHRLVFTLYSREEYSRAIETLKDPKDDVDLAWAFFVGVNSTFSAAIVNVRSPGTWGRSKTIHKRNIADPCNSHRQRLKTLDWWHEHLQGVLLLNEDGINCIQRFDSDDTVFYVDPPYILDTRKSKDVYYQESDNDFHERLVETLLKVKGAVILSGYDHPIYDSLNDWLRVDRKTKTTTIINREAQTRASTRTEVLWVNPKAQSQLSLSL